MPYLNSAPFYQHNVKQRYILKEYFPSQTARAVLDREIFAGIVPIVDTFKYENEFSPIANLGITVAKNALSALLLTNIDDFNQLKIKVTNQTSTSVLLLKVLLKNLWKIKNAQFIEPEDTSVNAWLLIGNDALKAKYKLTGKYCIYDLGEKWHELTRMPFTFAIWSVQKKNDNLIKAQLEADLRESLQISTDKLTPTINEYSLEGVPDIDKLKYIRNFSYKYSAEDCVAMEKFRQYVKNL